MAGGLISIKEQALQELLDALGAPARIAADMPVSRPWTRKISRFSRRECLIVPTYFNCYGRFGVGGQSRGHGIDAG